MNKEKKIMLVLFLITVLIRTFYVFKIFNEKGDSYWVDAKLYTYYGKEFANGNVYPVLEETKLLIPPVIPLVYAFFHIILPDNYWPFFIYNILLSSIQVILLYFIGKMLWNKSLGYVIALWGLFFFDYMKYTPTVLKEPTICFLLILLVFLALKYQQNHNQYKHVISIGLTFILLIHTDERYLAFFPIVVILPFINKKEIRLTKSGILQSLILTIFILLLMIPWTIRNYIEYNEIVLLSPRTTAITSKFWGTNQSTINFEGDIRAYQIMEARNDSAKEYTTNYGIEPRFQKGMESKIMAFINYWQPTYFRPSFIQYGYRFQKWSLMHNLISLFFYGIFLPFFILGLVRFIRERETFLIWLGSIPLLHSLIHAYMVWPLERYRMPINFIIILFALLFLFDLFGRIEKIKHLKYFSPSDEIAR